MKIKMVKMGVDIDEMRNYRIRGIVPTKDEKYLFVEVEKGIRPQRKYTSLSQKEYELKYPNPDFICINAIFRVDIPTDYRNSTTLDLIDFEKAYYELSYTNEKIVELLRKFNEDIEDIELVDDDYIDKFCEEKGFYEAYDKRLESTYKPIEIVKSHLGFSGPTKVNFLYTCYSANGTECSEIQKDVLTFYSLVKQYGKETIQPLVNDYISKLNDVNLQKEYEKNAKEVFDKIENELNVDLKNEDIDIDI